MAIVKKRKITPQLHEKKRNGNHHRKGKQYHKAYWPYLPMIAIFVLGVFVNHYWLSSGQVLGTSTNFSTSALLFSTNNQRQTDHESVLTINNRLMVAAQAKATDMVRQNYWSHFTPNGKSPWTFIEASGYNYQQAGENLAYGFNSSAETVDSWMNSPEHRANILNSTYQDVGFGRATAVNFLGRGPAIVIVALYAQPASTISFRVPPHSLSNLQNKELSNQSKSIPVSRFSLLYGRHPNNSTLIISLVMVAAISLFLFRHAKRLRKLIILGETFIARHLVIDFLLVVIITGCFVLNRIIGTIH